MNPRRVSFAFAVAAAMLAGARSAVAEDARLPKPRPPVGESAAELWAAGLKAKLEAAEADSRPPAKPLILDATGAPPAAPLQAIEALARTPKPRPEPDRTLLALVDPRGSVDAAPIPALPPVSDAEQASCLARLRTLDVTFTEESPLDPGGPCEVARPLVVSSVGDVEVTPPATMNCATAEALAQWSADVLAPAARSILDAAPTAIMQASAYVCRPRNNVPGAKLSEHARANAFDVASVAFRGRDPLSVGDAEASDAERRLEAAIRVGACGYFTTVLGPGSDAAHATHLHFDLAKRRSDYRLCDLGPAIASGAPKTKRE